MIARKWLKNNIDIVLGGIFPIICFLVIWTLSFLDILSGWIGLGVFAFSLWICLLISLGCLIFSIWKNKKLLLLRNVWFLPSIILFISTIGINIFENVLV
jgi:hypothetical protein